MGKRTARRKKGLGEGGYELVVDGKVHCGELNPVIGMDVKCWLGVKKAIMVSRRAGAESRTLENLEPRFLHPNSDPYFDDILWLESVHTSC